MAASFWCLKRSDDKVCALQHIPLSTGREVTLGRGLDVNIQLLSESNPLMISRTHATFQETSENTWTVKDHKSTNGIYVNSKKIRANRQHELKEGDVIQLGISPNENTPAEFVFKLIKEEHTEKEVQAVFAKKKRTRPANQKNGVKRKHSETNSPYVKEEGISNKEGEKSKVTIKVEPKTKKCKVHDSQEAGPSEGETDTKSTCSISRSPQKPVLPKPDLSAKQVNELKEKLKEQEKLAEIRVQEAQQQLDDMQTVLAANECVKEHLEEQLKQKEKQMLKEMEKQQERLQAEKQLLQIQMREFMEKQLREKEEKMLTELKQQKEALISEKKKVEESLQKELQTKLQEKDKNLQAELEREKEKLEDIISKKELEFCALENELKESNIEREQQEIFIQKAKEEAIQNVAEVMEDELQCCLCYELFVQATTLNCSHSFCYWCITEWTERKKHKDCPVCRAQITSKNKSIVLDSYIDKMVENLNDELKQRRVELVEERKKQLTERNGGKRTSPRKQGRGTGRQDGGDGGAGTSNAADDITGPATRTRSHIVVIDDSVSDDDLGIPIELSSDLESDDSVDDENSDDSDEMEDDSDEMEDEPYYGGHGRCFNCGKRGHWANGCPFR
ncbi:E3 ubiquitin-protein ligase RNF8-like [Glandiceps talaboti]